MPLLPTPYDQRIERLQQRIKQPGKQRRAQNKLQRFQGKQYFYQQQNRPPEPYQDAAYNTQIGNLTQTRDQGLADIAGRELATEQQYGYGADQSNPFSQARLLQQQFQQRAAGTTNTYAGRGQLYSGALTRQQGSDRFAAEQALDTSTREYQSRLADLERERLGAGQTYRAGEYEAQVDALERALEQRPEASEAPKAPKAAKQYKQNLNKKLKKAERKNRTNKIAKLKRRLEKTESY